MSFSVDANEVFIILAYVCTFLPEWTWNFLKWCLLSFLSRLNVHIPCITDCWAWSSCDDESRFMLKTSRGFHVNATHAGCIALAWVGCSVASVCLRSKRKTAWAISSQVGRHIVHGRTSACTDPDVKRSNPNPKPRVLIFAMGMDRDAEQRGSACQYDCTFLYLLSIFIKWQENLHSPDVGLHVNTTAHFSSCSMNCTHTQCWQLSNIWLGMYKVK